MLELYYLGKPVRRDIGGGVMCYDSPLTGKLPDGTMQIIAHLKDESEICVFVRGKESSEDAIKSSASKDASITLEMDAASGSSKLFDIQEATKPGSVK